MVVEDWNLAGTFGAPIACMGILQHWPEGKLAASVSSLNPSLWSYPPAALSPAPPG